MRCAGEGVLGTVRVRATTAVMPRSMKHVPSTIRTPQAML